MLDESQVISKLCKHLEGLGFSIEQRLTPTRKGVDVIAHEPKSGLRLLVEAKGGTSSRKGSERYGKPYTDAQVFNRTAKAVYTAIAAASSASEDELSCLALPDSETFRKHLWPVKEVLTRLRVTIFLVSEKSVVDYGFVIRNAP